MTTRIGAGPRYSTRRLLQREAVAYTDQSGRQQVRGGDRSQRGAIRKVILKICEVGNPVLRKIARYLSADEIGSKDIRELIGHMRDTVRDAPGVGLAAPQIGESLQIAVIEDKAEYQKVPLTFK
jgi:hypothetical protein